MITLKDFMLSTRANLVDGKTGERIYIQDADKAPDTEVFVFEPIDPNTITVWLKEGENGKV